MTLSAIHFIGICGTAMATLAAMLKARGHDVQGSDHGDLSADERFPRARADPRVRRLRPEHITAEIDLVVVGNAISRGNPSSKKCSIARSASCRCPRRSATVPLERAVDRHRRHARQDDDDRADGWLLTAVRAGSERARRRDRANFDGSYRLGSGRDFVIEGDEYDSAFFDKTAKFLKSNTLLLAAFRSSSCVQELAVFEERAVIFVAFDDEVPARIRAGSCCRSSSQYRRWARSVAAACRQEPARQRRRRGFPVRAGDDDRSRRPEEVRRGWPQASDRNADLPIEDRFESAISARDGVADDDADRGRRVMCSGA